MMLGNGRYELLEFVSKGGMGAVYRARDVELERQVAVKCLLDVSREEARRLALKEARTLASLSHPNIMRVFDVLQQGQEGKQVQQVWIVGEWLEGLSLGQYPLPLPSVIVLAVMAQVYDALSAAHAAQVIHRDVKPGNVMIGPDGRVTLIDFGVAFAPGASTGATIAGSLRYTDPRILEGQPPDALTDLFSAALLQVELMTGQTVLPDLAPLPLYRHAKKHLRQRLDELLDGAYPPLAALARRAMASESVRADAAGAEARAVAREAHDLLRQLTDLSPAAYLARTLCSNRYDDSETHEALRMEAMTQLANPLLTPRQRAAWMTFESSFMATNGEAPSRTSPDKGAPFRTATAPARQPKTSRLRLGRGTSEASADHHRLLSVLAILVLILAGAVIFMLVGRSPEDSGTRVAATTARPITADPGDDDDERVAASPAAGDLSVTPRTPDGSESQVLPAPSSSGGYGEQRTAPAPVVAVHLTADAWARVLINGKEAGRLPQAAPFQLPPGRHKLRLENPSVQTFETEVLVEAGAPQRLHYHLKPKTAERLIKLAAPGRLYVDGVDQGLVTEKRLSLSYGTHTFKVERGGRTVREASIAVGPEGPNAVALE